MPDPSLHDSFTLPTLDFLELTRDRFCQYLACHAGDLAPSEISRLNSLQTKLEHSQIDLAAFGLVSRGKTAVINALLGKKIGVTGAVHGITQAPIAMEFDLNGSDRGPELLGTASEASIGDRPKKVQLKLIDTPGLDEINGESKGELAKAIALQADLILFVIAGDMTRLEQEMLSELQNACKPILLVFNKADLYPECDRAAIHAALQNEQLRRLISTAEIIFTAAEPLPTKVRLEYVGAVGSRDTTETWEPQPPQVQALKQKILDLLNQEGKALLAINALRALAEVQDAALDRRLQKLPRLRSVAAMVFAIKAIALVLAPSFWLDAAISATIDLPVVLVWMHWTSNSIGSNLPLWLGAILLNAILTAVWGLEAQITQIGWLGITMPFMLNSIQLDLQRHSGWGKVGARTLMQQILQQVPANSILSRISISGTGSNMKIGT
jgi:small GTP-binding protein